MSSYQGGHVEYFKHMLDLVRERGGDNIKVFGGGGGADTRRPRSRRCTNTASRAPNSPDDGREMGLQGMINDLMEKSDYPTGKKVE